VFAGLLLSLLQLARVTAAAMRISPRIGFIAVPFETSSYAFTNVSAGQTVHRPPLKRRVVTTKQPKPRCATRPGEGHDERRLYR
jgi:hypothetical protein